jgi:hypothetical protein
MISALFYFSALYDGLLGLAFLLAPLQIFDYFKVPPPNHLGYVQFAAMLLLIFALIFFQIAREPLKKKDLIIYGILLKISYCSVTTLYWLQGTLPEMWRPFTICDAFMGILYAAALAKLSSSASDPHIDPRDNVPAP